MIGRCAAALALCAGACTSFDVTVQPTPPTLAPATREVAPAVEVALRVRSTFAPLVDGALDLSDTYARDGLLGELELARYRDALAATGAFARVLPGDDGDLRLALTILSGREPANEPLRVASTLLLGLLPHRQREVVRLTAVASRPGRAARTYELVAHITSRATRADDTRLRRRRDVPERALAADLVAFLRADGWLDVEAGR